MLQDGWDLALLIVAGYVAVTALVRLMIRRRDQLLDEFRREMHSEKGRKQSEDAEPPAKRQRAAAG